MLESFRTSVAARLLTPLLAWVALVLLPGCGQKGPLTLPPAAKAVSAGSAASAP
jgi:predicted small lipoprotein YifL